MDATLRFDPDEFAFMGINHPVRTEADLVAVEVEGRIPAELNGAYYRVGPDPTYPPFHKNFGAVDGNGMMVMFRFHDGQVDFRSRYVHTERLLLEREANRALFGEYRNPFTDDPAVRGRNRGTANTSMKMHAGKLWALKEDSLGVVVEEATLRTVGSDDFDGRVTSKTMTAHPKMDPSTGEMIFYGAAARGETTPDIAVYVADAQGRIVQEEWLVAPYASMVHDFAVTENWIVIPVMPTVSNMERMRAGGPIYDWEPERGMYLGLLPRRGTADQIRWVHSEARWFYHTMNAYEDGNTIHLDVAEAQVQPFPGFHADPMKTWNPDSATPQYTRWTIDTVDGTLATHRFFDMAAEMPRVDERFETRSYRHGFLLITDPHKPASGLGGGPMNTLAHWDHQTSTLETAYAGDGAVFEEPQFIPRSADAPEGDGFLLAITHHVDSAVCELSIFDTADLDAGPVARVTLPFRVRPGIHGTWVPEP